jgi:hypothetical protein
VSCSSAGGRPWFALSFSDVNGLCLGSIVARLLAADVWVSLVLDLVRDS